MSSVTLPRGGAARGAGRAQSQRLFVYVAAGLLAGLAYAFLNTQTDDWARDGGLGRFFSAFHSFVDRFIGFISVAASPGPRRFGPRSFARGSVMSSAIRQSGWWPRRPSTS